MNCRRELVGKKVRHRETGYMSSLHILTHPLNSVSLPNKPPPSSLGRIRAYNRRKWKRVNICKDDMSPKSLCLTSSVGERGQGGWGDCGIKKKSGNGRGGTREVRIGCEWGGRDCAEILKVWEYLKVFY